MPDVDGSHTVSVAASRDVCVAILLDAARYPEWYDTLDRIEVERIDAERRPLVVAVTVDAGPLGSIEFSLRQSYELPEAISGRQVGARGRIVNAGNRWTLRPTAAGATEVTYAFSADASGFAAKAALRAARPLVERDLIRGFAESLKRRAEAVAA